MPTIETGSTAPLRETSMQCDTFFEQSMKFQSAASTISTPREAVLLETPLKNLKTAHQACIDDIIMFGYSVDCVFHATCNFKMIKINIIN